MRLFRQFILRHLARERLRSGVTVLGIALGVAVVVAIQLTNASSLRGFETAIEAVSGKTSLEVVGPGTGFDESLLGGLAWLREYGRVSPVIEADARARTPGGARQSLRVLGVDILRDRPLRDYRLLEFAEQRREPRPHEFLNLLLDPRSVVLTEKFARAHGLAVGGTVELTTGDRVESFVVRGLLKDEGPARTLDGNFALMDIAAAQLAFDRLGRLDRLDVRLAEGVNLDETEAAIAGRLPAGLIVQRPARRGRQVEKMLEAFHFNLTALSYIALLVGLFLIYNTVSTSVITRRGEVGALRALGATRRTVLGLFLAEAAALAAAGCLLGLPLGRLLASGTVRITATTVNSLYIATAATPVPLGLRHVVLAFGVGVPLALLAAAVPALEAARVTPVAALGGADRLETRYRLRPIYLVTPLLLLALAWWLSRLGPVGGLPLFGYGAALAVVFGGAFLVPAVLYGVSRLGRPVLARLWQVEGRLAHANFSGAIPRTAISVAALAASLSMMVAITVMIGSFRETVVYWIGQTLRADLYLQPATRTNAGIDATVSPEVERVVTAHPAVVAVNRYRNFGVPYEGSLITLGMADYGVLSTHGNLLFKEPGGGRPDLSSATGQDVAIASESFALKYSKAVGDTISVPTPRGPARLRLAGVYYDYSSDRGELMLDGATFARHFGEQRPMSISLYLRPGADPDAVRAELFEALGDRFQVFIYTNAALRRQVMRIFDSTFAITYALEAIAILVAIMGIVSTLLTLILERRREIAVLRMLGADRRQVRKMVVIEAALLGGASQGIGIGMGLLLSLVLIYVINVQSFGWTIQFHLPAGFLLQSSALIVVATALAGIYPAHRAARLPVAAEAAEG